MSPALLRGLSSGCDNDIDFPPDKLGSDLGGALSAPLRPANFQCDVAPLDPTEFAQLSHKSGGPQSLGRRGACVKKTYGSQLSVPLRACGGRPGDRRPAEKRDELAPLHSITSSA
jgi:hypothetical protein